MRNLKLSSELALELELQSKEEVLLFSAFDIEQNRVFFASSANVIYTTQLASSQKARPWSKNLLFMEAQPIDLEPGDFITALDYLLEKEALVVGTFNGHLLLLNGDRNATEVVGTVEGGVQSISPSPDGELIALITGLGRILVMTHEWDVLQETTLADSCENIDVSDTPSSGYPVESPISWRGDGKYFVTLSKVHNPSSLLKKLKIWERNSGELHAASESKTFMGSALDWMPSGAKVASVYDRKTENKCPSIVFFERNGLERSSFSINELMDVAIEIVKWNCSSDLLAAIVRCERYDAIKIWSFNNNHWYLKQELRYPKKDGVKFMWDPTKPLNLICWTLGGQITAYCFIWMTAVMDNSTALVIDGSSVLVTPLSVFLIPPPMFLFNLKFPSAVSNVAFFCKNSNNQLAACLSDGSLCIVELPAADNWEALEGKDFITEASFSETLFGSLKHFIWLDSHILLGISIYGFGNDEYRPETMDKKDRLHRCYLQEIELTCSEDHAPGSVTSSGWSAKITNQICLEGPVNGIAPNPVKTCSAFIQFDDGRIVEYMSKFGIVRAGLESISQKLDYGSGFSSSCPWMNVVPVHDNGILKPLFLGLDENSRLYANGRILCNNCSSFSFYSNLADQIVTHLIITTKQDLLFIVDVGDIFYGNLELKYENFMRAENKRKGEENRNFINIWERGAKIAGVINGDEAAVILQTTRGNLECIYPRKLVLSSIVNALTQGRFKDALVMVRRHRMDFNVIVDHCGWQMFLRSAADFVRQVNNLSYITDFVCSIKNENVVEKLYKNFISLPNSEGTLDTRSVDLHGFSGKSKVSSVLLSIRKALEEHVPESPARELCILTTLARSDPPALEEALTRIKVVRDMELLNTDNMKRNSYPSSEEALKHLLWLSDSEAVYEAALGLYDMNLAAIVALNSQRDPKEFLPFLQGLERMPTIIMQYTIDLRLHRHESALRHIVSAGDAYYDDSISLMKSNPQLFSLGLQLFTDPAKRSQVLEAWGDHLHGEKFFDDAAATYLCCSSFERALKAYRASGNWSGVLTVAGLLKLEKEEVTQLAYQLCEELQALGKPGEAAKIALEYCGDIASGISLLVSAREWEEAVRIGFMHRRDDLVLQVTSAALECTSMLIGEYEEGLEKVGKYLARYLAVRQRRLLLAAKLQSEDRSTNGLDDDVASEASSNFTGMSAYSVGTRKGSAASISSSTTSKGREARRQRNRGKIRPGSPGEEIALVDHLKGMSPTSGSQRELKSLLVALVILGKEDTARKLQHTGENFELSQMAAVKLAEDTISSESIDEITHTLQHYLEKVKGELLQSRSYLWQLKVLSLTDRK